MLKINIKRQTNYYMKINLLYISIEIYCGRIIIILVFIIFAMSLIFK